MIRLVTCDFVSITTEVQSYRNDEKVKVKVVRNETPFIIKKMSGFSRNRSRIAS